MYLREDRLSDFVAACSACGQKGLGKTCGHSTSTCEGCWSLTESVKARFCLACTERKNRCTFCAADLRAVQERHPLPVATLLSKTPIPSAPMWIIDAILTIFVLGQLYGSYYFIFLGY